MGCCGIIMGGPYPMPGTVPGGGPIGTPGGGPIGIVPGGGPIGYEGIWGGLGLLAPALGF